MKQMRSGGRSEIQENLNVYFTNVRNLNSFLVYFYLPVLVLSCKWWFMHGVKPLASPDLNHIACSFVA